MTPFDRLCSYWVYGGFLLSFVFIGILGVFAGSLSLLQVLICLHLPAYMWHQYEEHDGNRFKYFADRMLGEGVLTQGAIFVINVLGVWLLFAALILGALRGPVGIGLGVVYLTLVNGVTHLVPAVKTRSYNPGLITAVILFLPLSGATLAFAFLDRNVPVAYQLAGLGIGLGVHLLIIVYALHRRQRLRS